MINSSKARWSWLLQVISGAVLLLLLGLHWIAQHYLAAGGLRSYAEVVEYLRQPVVFALELSFLVVVTSHALLGVRSMVLDLNPSPAAYRVLNVFLFFVGFITIAYGIQLIWQILH